MAAQLRENAMRFRESQPSQMRQFEINAFVDEAYAHAEKASKLGALKIVISETLYEKTWLAFGADGKWVYKEACTVKEIPASELEAVAKMAKDKYGIAAYHDFSTWSFEW